MLGTTEWIIIFGTVVLLFGADKLPRLGSSIGESIKNFRKGIKSEDPNKNQELEKISSDKHHQNKT